MRFKKFQIPVSDNGFTASVWAEIDSSALQNNYRQLRKLIGKKVLLMGMVKANAYGHGIIEISQLLQKAGIDYLGVNSLKEALVLRESNITVPILILGEVQESDFVLAVKNHFEFVGYSIDYLKKLDGIAADLGKEIKVHLKIDTGMGRMGVLPDQLPTLFKLLPQLHFTQVTGVMTHFANSDEAKKPSYFQKQLGKFQEVLFEFQKGRINPPLRHTANSAATLLYSESHFDLVRVGAALYGLWPSRDVMKLKGREVKLKPVLTLKTKVVQIKTLKKGSYSGYGCTFKVPRDLKVAILPVGYAEGLPRLLSNEAEILIRGKRAKVRGRISMNLTVVELTKIPEAEVGDEAVVIGKQGKEEITADELAKLAETINYEIVTRIASEIPRIIV